MDAGNDFEALVSADLLGADEVTLEVGVALTRVPGGWFITGAAKTGPCMGRCVLSTC